MKVKSRIILIIIIVITAAVIVACDALVAPLKARTNPYDEGTAIQPPYNFYAEAKYGDEGLGGELTWEWTDNGSDTDVQGFYIIRKVGSAPASVYDGSPVTLIYNTEDAYYFDTIELLPGYPDSYRGYEIYYAIFSYASKWDENSMSEDEKISLEEQDGEYTANNLYNYNFNGPIGQNIEIWENIRLPIYQDGYISTIDWNNTDDNMLVSTVNGVATSMGLITFDIDEKADGDLRDIYLVLRTYATLNNDCKLQVAPFSRAWDYGANTFDALDDDDDVVMSYAVTATINSGDYIQTWIDVTDIYNAWNDVTLENYGLRLMWYDDDNTTQTIQFFTTEDVDEENNWPQMNVYFMY